MILTAIVAALLSLAAEQKSVTRKAPGERPSLSLAPPLVLKPITPIRATPSKSIGPLTLQPGVISTDTKMKLGPNYDVIERYGAAPAVVNLTFGRK